MKGDGLVAKKKRRFFGLFVFPGLAGILLFVLLPFADVVKRSFTTAVTGQWNGLKNYGTIFHNQAFVLAVKNTVRFTVICIPLLVFTGLFIALLLNGLKGGKWMKSIFLFPLAMPTATVVLVWKLVFYRQGFFNLFLSRLGETTGLWGEIQLRCRLLGFSRKLSLEKHRLYGNLVAGGNWRNPCRAFGGGKGGRRGKVAAFAVYYSAQFKGKPLYHSCFILSQFL